MQTMAAYCLHVQLVFSEKKLEHLSFVNWSVIKSLLTYRRREILTASVSEGLVQGRCCIAPYQSNLQPFDLPVHVALYSSLLHAQCL